MNICKPPDPLSFTGNNAKNWCDFKEQLQWFLAGTESTEKDDAVKIGIMLSHAGREAREVFKTLPWTAVGDDKKFDKVLEAFENFCSPQKNILYERYGFWTLQQDDDELIDAYLTRLKLKIDDCEYNTAVKTELTRDKFVFGLRDDSLKERLLRESDLTLSRAVSIVQRSESSKKHVKEMTNSKLSMDCDEVRYTAQLQSGGKGKAFNCGQCGRTHKPRQCPAYGQQCSVCHKFNHFAKVCRNKHLMQPQQPAQVRSKKKIHVVDDQESDESENEPTLYMDPLQINGLAEESWLSTISTSSGDMTFKLDTGAEASVIPTKLYNKLKVSCVLNPFCNSSIPHFGV